MLKQRKGITTTGHDSQLVRPKEKLKLSHGRQASGERFMPGASLSLRPDPPSCK